MSFVFKTRVVTRLADTHTPVSIYLKLRDKYPGSILLESSERYNSSHQYSYICLMPVAGIVVANGQITEQYPDGSTATSAGSVIETITKYINRFSVIGDKCSTVPGMYGYITYDAAQYFEDIEFTQSTTQKSIADIRYHFYKYVLVFNHLNKEITIIEYILNDNEANEIKNIELYLQNKYIPSYPFTVVGTETSNCTDEEFLDIIRKGKEHCFRGDVFQIVLSREFSVKCKGDDFNAYRALRSINPSPYLFYFDYGDYRLMGSSPEAQLKINADTATIHPIAGTYRRTNDPKLDNELAQQLKEDSKENAEHVMLVDLARNDLSKSYADVNVTIYKEIQSFSHVLHMVSEVTGCHPFASTDTLQVVADTFPAGTLSGAPKHKAMQLIDKYENNARGFYGGCIGFMGLDGSFNHAIMIRSLLSKNNTLFYRAGAGVVAASDEQKELEEVNNKLAAIRKAFQVANTL